MRSHVWTAPLIQAAVSFDRLQLLVSRERNSVQSRQFVKCPALRPFHARPVITIDINDQRIVAEAHVLNRLHDASDSVVCVFLITGIHLHLMRIQFLYVRRYAVPGWERWIAGRKFGGGWNHTELLLPRKRLLAQLVPALIKLALVFVAPFLRNLVWRVTSPR